MSTFFNIIFIKQRIQQLNQKRQVTTFDIMIFLRQLATLIAAGVSIIQSCDVLEKSQEKIALRLAIYAIKRDILSGKNLFQSLHRHPHLLDEFTRQMIRLGEQTGKLDFMLLAVANYQEKRYAFFQRIKQALFYPCIITVIAVLITFGMFIFVIPKFAELFHDMQDKLPSLTVGIFYLSTQLQQHIEFFLGFFLLLGCAFFSLRHSISVRHYVNRYIAKLPLIKPTTHKIMLARFARNIALAFTAGMPITDALKLTADVCGNAQFATIITKLRNNVIAGLQLHHAMATLSCFPLLMTQMVKIGEESGTLELMLDKVADFFEADINQLINHLIHLLEPLLMVILGVLIGGLVIGMYLPLFKLGYLN